MMLRNIRLPSAVISNLYKNSLVDLSNKEEKPKQENQKVSFLGGNKKRILLIVDNDGSTFLGDEEQVFLAGVLSACKLSMEDIVIVNLANTESAEHKNFPEFFNAEAVILFNIQTSVLSLPFNIPDFQVQSFKNKKYLFAPALTAIKNDTQLKRKLWDSLKNIFSL